MDRADLETAFRLQAGICQYLGSPFYQALMTTALADVRADGRVAQLLDGWSGDPVRAFLPLRLFGAVHEIVLAGAAPALARYYPTMGGTADPDAAWPAFLDVLVQHPDRVHETLQRFPQTNEVRRSAGLLGGFLEVARRTGLPLRLRELGCSAGLNLQWRRYRYRLGPHVWGDRDSGVAIEAEWDGPPPHLASLPEIESRAGCDLDPRPIDDENAVRRLESYVWADQPERLQQLRAAIRVAREDPPRVDHASAAEWLAAELSAPPPGVCTVVYHSSVWNYLPPEEQDRVRGHLEAAGRAASAGQPLAWLRHEDTGELGAVEIRLQLWPDGEERLLGLGHPHGRRVEWYETTSR
ncbi:MAG: DUF2332 domain-containing protein [Proteobacteria bacterium]|nr:DUF2332 domain-containing protein [Pseudomonadota bacterium]